MVFAGVVFLCSFLASISAKYRDPLLVQTSLGKINGSSIDNGVRSYMGIPYGKSPTGKRRFKPPEPMEPWSGILHANRAKTCFGYIDQVFGNFKGSTMWNPDPNTFSEDCLNLNIWVPPRTHGLLPVMIWIFGGGFYSGGPSLPLYNGSKLAEKEQVIVVNINYRLGPFGFLYLGRHTEASGNMGLLDQQEALRWIQSHIRSFNGDPEQVTLFGESAGAASVSSHLIAPGSRRLFQRAIMQSGAITNIWATSSPQKMERKSWELAAELNCGASNTTDPVRCLQDLSAEHIQEKSMVLELRIMEFGFVPVTHDGRFFPKPLEHYIRHRDVKRCPVVIGTNSDEGSFWLPYNIAPLFKFKPQLGSDQENLLSRSDYLEAVNRTFFEYFPSSVLREAIAFRYSGQMAVAASADRRKGVGFRDGVSRFFGDFFFTCDVRSFAEFLVESDAQVYLYLFTQRSSVNQWPKWMGAMHGYEIEYIFGDPLRLREYSDEEERFTRKIMKYWAEFARTGVPSSGNQANTWALYSTDHRRYIVLNALSQPILTLNDEYCRFWKEVKEKANCAGRRGPVTTSGVSSNFPRFCFLSIVPLVSFASCRLFSLASLR